MTQSLFRRLKSLREKISVISWMLIIINLIISAITIGNCLINNQSLTYFEPAIIVIIGITMIIGLMAVFDMAIYMAIKSKEVKS